MNNYFLTCDKLDIWGGWWMACTERSRSVNGEWCCPNRLGGCYNYKKRGKYWTPSSIDKTNLGRKLTR